MKYDIEFDVLISIIILSNLRVSQDITGSMNRKRSNL
jgi:hypothetical protein